ncbi:MAG: serine/threonine protein kinase [Actinomycetota bacterium]|nr:serine/threonine protein kinase [Actinomycetota bacterium]
MKKASWEFEEGDEIVPGRYALRRLGGGKRYEVYLAWDDKLFSQVVVKVVRPDQIGNDKSVQDLRREADTVGGLAHPMLVRSFGVSLQDDRPHLVLEHIEGPTLRRLIKGYGPLPLEQLVPLAVQVCGALHYMATESIVHLDVKPSNVVMSSPPKLIDLSVARTHDAAKKLTQRVGTRSYMAPEQCEPGPNRIGTWTDVWGAGVTFYEAVTGTRAFHADKEADTEDKARAFPQLVEDPPAFPKETPGPIAELILACLDKDPRSRPQAAEVARGFEPLLAAIPERPRLRRGRPKLR